MEEFSFGLESRQSPFDPKGDFDPRGCLFIWVTGRGQFSYLFQTLPEAEIIRELERSVPMGYTNVCVLEWVDAVHPEQGKHIKHLHRRMVEKLRHDRIQEGVSLLLLDESGSCFGWSDKRQPALWAAKVIAAERHTRVVIARLRSDITWH